MPLVQVIHSIISIRVWRCLDKICVLVMVSECALALLSPREKLPPIARKGGVLTPMAAFGTILMKRLSASGRFDFESEEVEDS